MAKTGVYQPIDTLPGVQPITDKTAVDTQHYTYSDKIRFVNGKPQKIGGWNSLSFDFGETAMGTIRSIFTDIINGKFYVVLGSNEKLYSLIGSRLTNITPFLTTSVSVPNSLDTHYDTLANNPLSTVNGSPVVIVADVDAAFLQPGDTVTLSGATTFAGIPAINLNGDNLVRTVGAGFFTINVGVNANATTSGGGAAVIRTSGLITVNSTAHDQSNGDRVKIEGAANTGGILAADINKEFIMRNVLTDSFDVMTDGVATSSVTSGGGAGVEYYEEIPPGAVNETTAQGYGAGLYGAGLYGTALTSTTSRSYPRIWFMDRYADTVIVTPGNQTPVYQWQGSNEEAPAPISGAPDEINYAFVSDNILVTFGASDMSLPVENRIYASDQNDITQWTSSSTNQVFDDDIEGAGRLISHCPVEDYNLIFTENQTYTFRYIGLPFVWEVKELDNTIGIIAPMARANVKGMAVWMGADNFYLYRGGTVEVIRANSQDESTCLDYVFGDMNWGQKSKIHAYYNKQFNEVWFHYPSANSNECDRVVKVNILDFTWTVDQLERSASNWPRVTQKNPILANVGTVYQHETGYNDDGDPMPFTLVSNKRYYGKDNVNLNAVIPDSIQTGEVTFMNDGYLFPQSSVKNYTNTVQITTTTEYLPVTTSSRFHQYTWYGEDLDQYWQMGAWLEEVQKGPTQ